MPERVFVKVNGDTHYLWRAVDHEGEVLESYVTKRRALLSTGSGIIRPEPSGDQHSTDETSKIGDQTNKRTRNKPDAPVAPTTPPMTKRDRLQARLEEAGGASLAQLTTAFGWQPHTVRAAISGLRKAGFVVQRETVDGASVYRIVAPKAA